MAISLDHVRVKEAMHAGIVAATPDTPLRAVARQMAEHRVHAVAVVERNQGLHTRGIVSALDIAAAVASDVEPTAGEMASNEVVTVSTDDRLDYAARLMSEHRVAHLVVLDRATGRPVGILSVLDLAAAYGG